MKKITVGSDYSGVGAFDQALRLLNIDYETSFSCDMDKYARISYIANYGIPSYYPKNVYDRDIPGEPLDIYMTSPPCQAFSMAGKRKGEDDKRGILFYNSHEFIKKNKPRYFIFENVKGLLSHDRNSNDSSNIGKTFQTWINYLGGKSINGVPILFPDDNAVPYHIYYRVLNSKNFGIPQNRERIFIVGIRDDVDNKFTWPKEIPLTLKLKDILQDNPNGKYNLSQKAVEGIYNSEFNSKSTIIQDKEGVSATLLSRDYKDPKCVEVEEKYYLKDSTIEKLILYDKKNKEKGNGFGTKFHDPDKDNMSALKLGGGGCDDLIKVKSATEKGYEEAKYGDSINYSVPSSKTRRGRVGKGVAQTLDTSCNQATIVAMRGRGDDNTQQLEFRKDELTNTITSVQKDNLVIQPGTWRTHKDGKGFRKIKDGTSPTIPARAREDGSGQPCIRNSEGIRRLTPLECFRLQGFPDEFVENCYREGVSDTQLYKQAGNSITREVLAAIINKLNL